MWKEQILVWEDTPHIWNNFGNETTLSFDNDDLYAKGIVIWKKISLGDFIEKALSMFEVTNDYFEDKNILTSFMLVVTAISLFPFHIKIIKDDDVANKFLSLIKREKAEHYILKEDFIKSEFGKIEALNLLIKDLVNNNILIDSGDRYIIKGKVLNGAHLLED